MKAWIVATSTDDFPLEHFFEIAVTIFADPVVVIGGGITFAENIRFVYIHEFCPAKFAMIRIPAERRKCFPLEGEPVNIFSLPLEPPVVFVDHR
jgi:hypothetical protein